VRREAPALARTCRSKTGGGVSWGVEEEGVQRGIHTIVD
jgi:hypothetical protein